ncbi:zf-HC2 domain-containing protein [Paenibacillus tepidiphilus]|uniref:zf-HC2 domain-containing protein n=1 Tax=Paenibacillus tepidiphilus TaxID=2608683 RepID=UPI0013A58699|nr:zf-HC2 domain-containing protein [Paenibacillus tepidiphilus]
MKCATVQEWMPHYIDGQLSPDLEMQLRLHIDTCPACAQWLEETMELASIWEGKGSAFAEQGLPEYPDITNTVMSEIERLENDRRERSLPQTAVRRRTAPRTAWMHYCLAVGLTLILVQLGIFENFAYGISEINGHMSSSVSAWLSNTPPTDK